MGKNIAAKKRRQIAMILWHDGIHWVLKNEKDASLIIKAKELDELDKKLENALSKEWQKEPLEVYMRTDNDIIPEWMRPFMDHYFNRILELPLRY